MKKIISIVLITAFMLALCACNSGKGDNSQPEKTNNESSTPSTTTQVDVCEENGHTLTLVPEVKAGCTQNGKKEYYKCQKCGKNFEDSGAKVEINDLSTWGVIKAGHKYVAVVTQPTYTQEGYTTYTCSVCGDSYVADKTAKLVNTIPTAKITSIDDLFDYFYGSYMDFPLYNTTDSNIEIYRSVKEEDFCFAYTFKTKDKKYCIAGLPDVVKDIEMEGSYGTAINRNLELKMFDSNNCKYIKEHWLNPKLKSGQIIQHVSEDETLYEYKVNGKAFVIKFSDTFFGIYPSYFK